MSTTNTIISITEAPNKRVIAEALLTHLSEGDILDSVTADFGTEEALKQCEAAFSLEFPIEFSGTLDLEALEDIHELGKTLDRNGVKFAALQTSYTEPRSFLQVPATVVTNVDGSLVHYLANTSDLPSNADEIRSSFEGIPAKAAEGLSKLMFIIKDDDSPHL